MKNTLYQQKNREIEVINIGGQIDSDVALELKDYICSCIDANKWNVLINMGGKDSINKHSIDVLQFAKKRGICVRLFNVGSTNLDGLIMEGNGMLKNIVYDTSVIEEALNCFRKEDMHETNKKEVRVCGRKHRRAEVFLLCRFSWLNEQDELISGKAQIINLSEGGMLAYETIAINVNKGGAINSEELVEKKHIPIRFNLNGESQPIVIMGEIVRIAKNDETLSAGISFKEISQKEISQDDRKRIKEYIEKKQTYKR